MSRATRQRRQLLVAVGGIVLFAWLLAVALPAQQPRQPQQQRQQQSKDSAAFALADSMAKAMRAGAPAFPGVNFDGYRYGYLDDPIALVLARAYKEIYGDGTRPAVEHAWCVTGAHLEPPPRPHVGQIVVVDAIVAPDSTTHATPTSVRVWCPVQAFAFIHTHDPKDCAVSDFDHYALFRLAQPFGVVLCGPGYAVFYWPYERPTFPPGDSARGLAPHPTPPNEDR